MTRTAASASRPWRRHRRPADDVARVIERLRGIPHDEAGDLLVRIVEQCRQAGIGGEILMPRERRFLERQYERAIRALGEVAGGAGDGAPAGDARRALAINLEAEASFLAEAGRAAA